jgi:hypothetical protein
MLRIINRCRYSSIIGTSTGTEWANGTVLNSGIKFCDNEIAVPVVYLINRYRTGTKFATSEVPVIRLICLVLDGSGAVEPFKKSRIRNKHCFWSTIFATEAISFKGTTRDMLQTTAAMLAKK